MLKKSIILYVMKQLINALKNKRNLIFFDLEGTQESIEIIAIGAVKVSLDAKYNLKSQDKKGFKKYVISAGEIGPYVEKLTSITPEIIKKEGITYEKMIDKFQKYIGKNPQDYVYITYGNYDIKLLRHTLSLHENYGEEFINIICSNYLDLSEFLARYLRDNKGNRCSLIESIVNLEGTPLVNEHDPLVDTKNLIILFDLITKKKKLLAQSYKEILLSYNKCPRPILNVLKKLKANENVTPKDFDTYIDDELK